MNTAALRTLIIYAVVLPLAVFIGWIAVDLANWNRTSFAMLAIIMFVLFIPALLKWHYPILVFSWSTYITIFFLPGQPALWMLMAVMNFGIAVLGRIMQKRHAFLPAPAVTISLLALLAIALITGKLRGGFGLSALGSATQGGKPYYFITFAVLGYFAFISNSIPLERARSYVSLFFLSGLVSAGSTLIYYAGPSFYFLFLIFPISFAEVQAVSEYSSYVSRIAGLSTGAYAFGFFLLARYGIRGTLRSWWRAGLFILVLGCGAMGGYRGNLLVFVSVFFVLFAFEGLFRFPVFPAFLLVGALLFVGLAPLASKLPLPIQRSLSFLPLQIDPIVRYDAQSSLEWRLGMWRTLLPDLPKYIWLGKGYALNPTDMYLTQQAMLRGRAPGYANSLLVGDYHSGPLSVFVPLGSFGFIAFLVFLGTAIRGLYLNYRYGSEELRTENRFLLAYFCGRAIFFFVGFGALSGDLYLFTGTIGLSIALNKGICQKPVAVRKPVQFRGDLELGGARPGVA